MHIDYRFYLSLSYASFFSIVVPLAVGLYRKKYFNPATYVLFYLLFTSLVAEATIFCLHLYHINNLFVSRAYTLVEFMLLSVFFLKVLPRPAIKFVIRLIIVLFLAIAATDLGMNGFALMDNISSTVESIILMVYTLAAFYFLVVNPPNANIYSTPAFWFYTGILTFFSCDLFLFIFSNYIQRHYAKVSYELWGIHSINNIIFYLLISIGFWKTKTK